MITYVNTVLVSNYTKNIIASQLEGGMSGQYIVVDADTNNVISTADQMTDAVKRIKIGMFTSEITKTINPKTKQQIPVPVIRWSNVINREDVKKFAMLVAPENPVTEDSVTIDFRSITDATLDEFAKGGKRIIVRLTFKDLPTRFRKWTESYEYVTVAGDTTSSIASNIANTINKQWKRARVIAQVGNMEGTGIGEGVQEPQFVLADGGSCIQLTAMTYSDDNSADSINRFEKVRFNVNVYYTDPAAEGWESLNKHFPQGLEIKKHPGFQYAASGKLVRDRENASFGYMGILNRGEGTWPIIQPKMNADINANYNAVTIEFENMYHTADDLMRRTKQTVELYTLGNIIPVGAILAVFAGDAYQPIDPNTETVDGERTVVI